MECKLYVTGSLQNCGKQYFLQYEVGAKERGDMGQNPWVRHALCVMCKAQSFKIYANDSHNFMNNIHNMYTWRALLGVCFHFYTLRLCITHNAWRTQRFLAFPLTGLMYDFTLPSKKTLFLNTMLNFFLQVFNLLFSPKSSS